MGAEVITRGNKLMICYWVYSFGAGRVLLLLGETKLEPSWVFL